MQLIRSCLEVDKFPELKEISKYVSSKDKDAKGSFGTNEIVLCNIFRASCRGSSQLSPISYEAIHVLLKILFLMFCCLLICLVVDNYFKLHFNFGFTPVNRNI